MKAFETYEKRYEQVFKSYEASVLKELEEHGYIVGRIETVGSAYISDNDSSDIDVLVLVTGIVDAPNEMLEQDDPATMDVDCMCFGGWSYGGSVGEGNESRWGSWKKDINGREVNMLITTSQEYFNSWLTATSVCRYLHLKGWLLDKDTIRSVHNIVMDDSIAEDEIDNAQILANS